MCGVDVHATCGGWIYNTHRGDWAKMGRKPKEQKLKLSCGESQGRDIHGLGERPDASLNPGLLHNTHRGDWAKMGRKPQGTKT